MQTASLLPREEVLSGVLILMVTMEKSEGEKEEGKSVRLYPGTRVGAGSHNRTLTMDHGSHGSIPVSWTQCVQGVSKFVSVVSWIPDK